jgi:hypothetical protein
MIRFLALLHFSCFYLHFPEHKKTKNISVVSLCLPFWFSSFGLLYFLFSVWYSKNPKIFCFVCRFLLFLLQNSKTQKYLLFFFGFVKFVAEFSLL